MNQACCRVLVADDDPTVALLMRATLTAPDFVVTVVDNGAAAWAEFNRSVFDIVLLDVEMPEMDGFRNLRCHTAKSGQDDPAGPDQWA
jgi:DNA-binding response OmpR family regulator